MYKFLLVLLIIVSVISCQKDIAQPESLSTLLDITEDHQFFTIPLDTTVTIKGAKGTEITVHSEDFEIHSSDDLKLTLIELHNPMDFVLHNIQTVSNDNWLDSGGSYFIQVTQNGEVVSLKKDRTVKVRFPKISNQSMELFEGERLQNGNMNWSQLDISLDYDEYKTFLIRDTVVLDVFNTYKYGLDMYIELPIVDNKGLMSRVDSEKLWNRYKVDTIITLNDTLVGIDTVREYIYSETEPIDTEYARDTSIKEIRRLFKNQNNTSNNLDSLYTYWKIQSQDFDAVQAKEMLLYRTIDLSQLDWINVDRFNEFEFEDEVALTIINDAYIQFLYVVFERTKAVVSVSSLSKKKIEVPANEPFTLIGFDVTENADIIGYKRTMKFKKDTEIFLELKKVSSSEIKEWLYR